MGKLCQFQTAIACSFGSLLMGLLNVWPSYTLGLYTSQNTTLLTEPMTTLESSLLGSMPSLGAMLGTAVTGTLMNKLGRKKSGLAITLPFVVSWATIGVTKSTILILIARFLGGVGGGAFLVYAPIFISEIAESSIRGALASAPIAFYCLGALLSYVFGWVLTYHAIVWINIAFSVVCAILVGTIVESPVYFLQQNREEDARSAIALYRGATPASKVVLEELSRLKQQLTPAIELTPVSGDDDNAKEGDAAEKEKLNLEAEVPEERPKMSKIKLLFVSTASRRAFMIVGTLLVMQVFMGMVPVQVYAKVLFGKAAPNLSSHFCSVLLAVVLLFGSLAAAVVADKAGRRILIIASSCLVSLCMISLGFLIQFNIEPAWVSALIILVFCCSFSFGAGTVPYILLSEVFVSEVQELATMLLIEMVWFLNFVIIAIFPLMANVFGIHGTFYIFGCFSVANVVLSAIIVPETKGLTNDEIQEILLKRRR